MVRHAPPGSRSLALNDAALIRLPIGSCPGKNAAAVLSLITATRGAVGAIVVREQPPAHQRNAHRLEVVRLAAW